VADVRRELSYERKVTLLTGGPRRRNAEHGGNQWLMVCEETKLPTFKQKPEMTNGGMCSQQLSIEGGVFHLCRRQLFGEKS
jgi:hypothetical protein